MLEGSLSSNSSAPPALLHQHHSGHNLRSSRDVVIPMLSPDILVGAGSLRGAPSVNAAAGGGGGPNSGLAAFARAVHGPQAAAPRLSEQVLLGHQQSMVATPHFPSAAPGESRVHPLCALAGVVEHPALGSAIDANGNGGVAAGGHAANFYAPTPLRSPSCHTVASAVTPGAAPGLATTTTTFGGSQSCFSSRRGSSHRLLPISSSAFLEDEVLDITKRYFSSTIAANVGGGSNSSSNAAAAPPSTRCIAQQSQQVVGATGGSGSSTTSATAAAAAALNATVRSTSTSCLDETERMMGTSASTPGDGTVSAEDEPVHFCLQSAEALFNLENSVDETSAREFRRGSGAMGALRLLSTPASSPSHQSPRAGFPIVAQQQVQQLQMASGRMMSASPLAMMPPPSPAAGPPQLPNGGVGGGGMSRRHSQQSLNASLLGTATATSTPPTTPIPTSC